ACLRRAPARCLAAAASALLARRVCAVPHVEPAAPLVRTLARRARGARGRRASGGGRVRADRLSALRRRGAAVISVVAPVYNESGSLAELHRRLTLTLSELDTYEIGRASCRERV